MTEHEREHEAAKRLDAFVDAAFAFAVTLLVIAGAEATATLPALWKAVGRIPASLGAFVLIAMFWLAYRDFGRIAPRRDVWASLNGLAIVFVVLVYVFPLRMLVESGFVWISGGRLPGETIIQNLSDLRMLFRVYGLGFVVLAILFVTLYAHAARSPDKLGVSAADAAVAADVVQIWMIVASGGLISALLTFAPIDAVPWLPGMAYCAIPLGIGARSLIAARRTRVTPASAD